MNTARGGWVLAGCGAELYRRVAVGFRKRLLTCSYEPNPPDRDKIFTYLLTYLHRSELRMRSGSAISVPCVPCVYPTNTVYPALLCPKGRIHNITRVPLSGSETCSIQGSESIGPRCKKTLLYFVRRVGYTTSPECAHYCPMPCAASQNAFLNRSACAGHCWPDAGRCRRHLGRRCAPP